MDRLFAHHRFTVDDYYHMAEVGILGPEARVELIDGVIEVWLIDLAQRQVVVCSDPAPDGYRIVEIARPEQTLRPLAFPNLLVDLAEILS